MTAAVLSVNAGSSSLKFGLYARGSAHALLGGCIENLQPGGTPVLRRDGAAPETLQPGSEGPFAAALTAVAALIEREAGGHRLVAVAHRIVHGGERCTAAQVVDDALLGYLDTLSPLAPLHQPHNLAGLRAFRTALPALPQVACFDTAFHATIAPLEREFALPPEFAAQGIRRYGFHGLSYQYLAGVLHDRTRRAAGRVLMAHLGNGSSACAMRGGRSFATSMGFSALDGLMMGTRCGSIDAGVLLHLLRQGWDVARLEDLLYRKSGLRGVSGLSADMRTLRASTEPAARHAIDLYTHRVVRESGGLTAVMGGLDVLAFTGGIGEHDARLRQAVCEGLAATGVRLDAEANAAAVGEEICAVHAPDSTVEVWVVPTDEGRVAADEAWRLVDARG